MSIFKTLKQINLTQKILKASRYGGTSSSLEGKLYFRVTGACSSRFEACKIDPESAVRTGGSLLKNVECSDWDPVYRTLRIMPIIAALR